MSRSEEDDELERILESSGLKKMSDESFERLLRGFGGGRLNLRLRSRVKTPEKKSSSDLKNDTESSSERSES